MKVKLVTGYWCQVKGFGWLPDSPDACQDQDHINAGKHIESARHPLQPGHSVIHQWM